MIRIIVFILISGLSQPALSDSCKRLVFNEYCLGGSLSELEEEKPPARKRIKGKKTMLVYKAGEDIVVIQGFTKKIMSVAKIQKPGSWLNYENLKSRLVKVHGPGSDESYFPDYADSLSSKATSISIGKGQAKHLWKKDDWKIVLLWSNNKSMTLFYIDEELESEYRGGNPEGL